MIERLLERLFNLFRTPSGAEVTSDSLVAMIDSRDTEEPRDIPIALVIESSECDGAGIVTGPKYAAAVALRSTDNPLKLTLRNNRHQHLLAQRIALAPAHLVADYTILSMRFGGRQMLTSPCPAAAFSEIANTPECGELWAPGETFTLVLQHRTASAVHYLDDTQRSET